MADLKSDAEEADQDEVKASLAKLSKDESSNEFHLCYSSGDMLKISAGNSHLSVLRLHVAGSKCTFLEECSAPGFTESIDRCFCYIRLCRSSALLMTKNGAAYSFDPESETIEIKEISIPPFKHILCPYSTYPFSVEERIDWSYWDDEAKVIKFTHNNHFTIKCDQLPTVRRNDVYDICSLIFVTADNNVIFVDARNQSYFNIPLDESCGEISSTTAYGDIVLIWCCEDESVLISTREENEFSPPEKYKWETESLFTSIDIDWWQYTLLPGLRNSSGKYDPYLFVVERESFFIQS